MSKFTTVRISLMPTPLFDLFNGHMRPPFLSSLNRYPCDPPNPSLCDVEFTFAIPEKEDEKKFRQDAQITMLTAYYMALANLPPAVELVVRHLVKTSDEWKANEKIDLPRGKLHAHFLHTIVERIGDVTGVDHRPCWIAGKCKHEADHSGGA